MFKKNKLTQLSKRKEAWQKKLDQSIQKNPERKEYFSTDSKISVETVCTPLEIKGFDYEEKLGLPGEYPFVRGVQQNMYRSRLFTMRQYAGFGNAEETNKRFHYLLGLGQTGLSIAFDLPTQLGYDSDHPLSKGEVGKVGVAIDSLK